MTKESEAAMTITAAGAAAADIKITRPLAT
jgi:hypothetical protein